MGRSSNDILHVCIETRPTHDPSGGFIVDGRPKNPTQHRVVLVPDGVASSSTDCS